MRYQPQTHDETDQGSSVGTAVVFLLIGLGAGALIGMLYSPKTGKQMRQDLRRKYRDACDTFDDLKDEATRMAEEVFERGSEIAESVRDRIEPLTKAVRR